jgi:hypothetical protein
MPFAASKQGRCPTGRLMTCEIGSGQVVVSNRSLAVSRVDNRRNSVEHLTEELFVFLLYAVNSLPSIGHVICNES